MRWQSMRYHSDLEEEAHEVAGEAEADEDTGAEAEAEAGTEVVAAGVAVNECVIFFRAAAMAAMACAAVSTGTWIRFEPLELKMHSAGESMRSA